MHQYLISYDLRKAGGDYGPLIAAIKALDPPGWCMALDSTWLISSDLTAAQVRDELQTKLYEDDRLLVVRLQADWASINLHTTAFTWLQERVD